MGVLINKYFKMPKSCDSCHFGQEYECVDEAGYGCFLTMKTRPKGETDRPDYCPLVEVSPHGDLISREWLIDIALHLMNTAKNDDIANGVKWLWQYVIEAPTIIESEVEE